MRYIPGVLLLVLLTAWLLVKLLWLLAIAVFWVAVVAVGLVFLWVLNKLVG